MLRLWYAVATGLLAVAITPGARLAVALAFVAFFTEQFINIAVAADQLALLVAIDFAVAISLFAIAAFFTSLNCPDGASQLKVSDDFRSCQ